MNLCDQLGRHLRQRQRIILGERGAISCAVLIPLVPSTARADYDIVYTLRSENLPNHKGQVAFPGGKRSGHEKLVETALRESHEEIGLLPGDVTILGCLDDVTTMAGQYVITPWVGLLPGEYAFEANPNEVADIFSVRLSELRDPRHHNQTRKTWGGNHYDLPAITAGRHEIWGATHQITSNFLEMLEQLERGGASKAPR